MAILLAVSDFTRFPYYGDSATAGNIHNPGRTPFQGKGAEAIAGIIADGIKKDPVRLQSRIDRLKESTRYASFWIGQQDSGIAEAICVRHRVRRVVRHKEKAGYRPYSPLCSVRIIEQN